MEKKIVLNGVKWTTISSIVTTICSLLSISILARYVDKSEFGLIAIAVFFLNFFDLFNDMGITAAILHKQNMEQEEYSSLYWFNIIVSIFLYCIVLLISPIVSLFYDFSQLKTLIPLLGLSLLINGIGRQFKIIQEKELRFKNISIVEISTSIVALLASSIFALEGLGIYALVANFLVYSFLSNLLFLIISLFQGHKLTFFYDFKKVKPFLKMGLYQMGGQIANYFNRDFDILIIGKLMGPEVLGIYSLAKQLVFRPFQIVNPIITKVVSPMLAKIRSSSEDLKISYLKVVNTVGSLNMIIYLLLFMFAPLAIKILYGPGFEEAIWIVRILCFYMIVRSVGNPIGSLTIATGKTYLEFYWNIGMLFITPLIIYIGALGNIYTSCIMLTCVFILSIYPFWKFVVSKMIDVSFSDYLKACFIIDFKMLRDKI